MKLIKSLLVLIFLLSNLAFVSSQTYMITGRVVNKDNRPQLADIRIEGTAVGTITDPKTGKFQLKHGVNKTHLTIIVASRKCKFLFIEVNYGPTVDLGEIVVYKGRGKKRVKWEQLLEDDLLSNNKINGEMAKVKFPKQGGDRSTAFEDIEWEGAIVNGKATGKGRGLISKRNGKKAVFNGTLQHGIAEGYGELIWDGTEYHCVFINGVCEGEVLFKAKQVMADGNYQLMKIESGKIIGDVIEYNKRGKISTIYQVKHLKGGQYSFDNYDYIKEQQMKQHIQQQLGAAMGMAIMTAALKGGYDYLKDAIKSNSSAYYSEGEDDLTGSRTTYNASEMERSKTGLSTSNSIKIEIGDFIKQLGSGSNKFAQVKIVCETTKKVLKQFELANYPKEPKPYQLTGFNFLTTSKWKSLADFEQTINRQIESGSFGECN